MTYVSDQLDEDMIKAIIIESRYKMKPKVYALYKGDTFLELGSRKKLANYLNVSENTITFYMSPTYKKRAKYKDSNRLIVIRVEED